MFFIRVASNCSIYANYNTNPGKNTTKHQTDTVSPKFEYDFSSIRTLKVESGDKKYKRGLISENPYAEQVGSGMSDGNSRRHVTPDA